jgi:hypothetical protein
MKNYLTFGKPENLCILQYPPNGVQRYKKKSECPDNEAEKYDISVK